MDLSSLVNGSAAVIVPDPTDQAAHAAAPTAPVKQDAKTIVLALAGMMAIFFALHVTERWAVKI